MAIAMEWYVLLELGTYLPLRRRCHSFFFKGEIQNIINDNAGKIITVTFTLNKQNFHITTLYGPHKSHHRENFFQSLTNHITSTQNTITGDDFNMVTEFRDRTGDTICITHVLGSIPLNEPLKN